jgi:regulator of protease activity HflC (stomatin/prohibitin superfamily)
MDRTILGVLNPITSAWGIEIIRLDIQSITPPESVRKSMEAQQNAQIKKKSAIEAAEGERQAAVKRAEGTRTSIEIHVAPRYLNWYLGFALLLGSIPKNSYRMVVS